MAWQKIKTGSPNQFWQAIAVLITLSVTGECLQCFWCGPLAEQVHRSQRAPPCEENMTNVTACEPGYTHCAVSASSPPFFESRYCVKFYQDECYTQYCGTTKTYRTTCPCRGELCNGPNTQREIDAFATMANTAAKAHNNRVKKRNAISNDFSGKYKKSVIENDPPEETSNMIDVQNENTNESTSKTDQPHITENELSNASEPHESTPKESEPNDNVQSSSASQDIPTTVHVEETVTTRIAEIATEATVNKESANEIDITPKVMEVKNVDLVTSANPSEAMKPTEPMKVNEKTFAPNEVKPSVMPTAEALQQGASPVTTEKPMEPTVTLTEVTMHMTTPATSMVSTKPTNSTKNNSVVLNFSVFVYLACLILNFLL